MHSHVSGRRRLHLEISRSFIQKFSEVLWNWLPNFCQFSIKQAGQLKLIKKSIFLMYFFISKLGILIDRTYYMPS